MLNFAPIAKAYRTLIGRNSSEPDIAVLALALVSPTGQIGASVDANGNLSPVNAPVLVSASGAVAPANGFFVITKTGSLAAITLAAPTTAQNGIVMEFTSNTALAHTITATGLINDGVTGGAKDVATFAAFAGASIRLRAYAAKWSVIAKNVVTIS